MELVTCKGGTTEEHGQYIYPKGTCVQPRCDLYGERCGYIFLHLFTMTNLFKMAATVNGEGSGGQEEKSNFEKELIRPQNVLTS